MIFVLLIITNGFTLSYCAKGHLPIIEYSNYIKIPETIKVYCSLLLIHPIEVVCVSLRAGSEAKKGAIKQYKVKSQSATNARAYKFMPEPC